MITPYAQYVLAQIGIVRYVRRPSSNMSSSSTLPSHSNSSQIETKPSDPINNSTTPSLPPNTPPTTHASTPTLPNMKTEKQYQTLSEIEKAIHHCQRCELYQARKNAVPGIGDHQARWLFVGEGPGAEEDTQGLPFVGSSGKLLDNCLAAAGLHRNIEIYITNAVKCRPPGNRTPTIDEIASCLSFLDQQIVLLQPKIIVAVGRTATLALLKDEKTPLGKMRQKIHYWENPSFQNKSMSSNARIPVVVTYHPSYLLRNLTEKKKSWQDIRFAFEVFQSQ